MALSIRRPSGSFSRFGGLFRGSEWEEEERFSKALKLIILGDKGMTSGSLGLEISLAFLVLLFAPAGSLALTTKLLVFFVFFAVAFSMMTSSSSLDHYGILAEGAPNPEVDVFNFLLILNLYRLFTIY